jgi:hypothetical protein
MRYTGPLLVVLAVGCGGSIGEFPAGKTAANYTACDLIEVAVKADQFVGRPIRLSAVVTTGPNVRHGTTEFTIAEKVSISTMKVVCSGKLAVQAAKELAWSKRVTIFGAITEVGYGRPVFRADRIEY